MEDTKHKVKQWVELLRSGSYKQDRGCLKTSKGYCCLGVYAKGVMSCEDILLFRDGREGGPEALPRVDDIYAKIRREFGSSFIDELISMNDSGKSFLEIADVIEQKYLLTN